MALAFWPIFLRFRFATFQVQLWACIGVLIASASSMSMSANASLSSVVFVDLDPSLVVFGPSLTMPHRIASSTSKIFRQHAAFIFLLGLLRRNPIANSKRRRVPLPQYVASSSYHLFLRYRARYLPCARALMMLPLVSDWQRWKLRSHALGWRRLSPKFVTAASPE